MRAPFRLLSIAVLGLAWLPAAAPGATVDRDPDTGVITIVDDVATADDITVERTATLDIVAGAGLTHFSGECTVVAETVECPLGSSVAVDLGEEDDRFTAPDMPAPISVAGGPGNDEITTGLADDVLAGGPDDDILDGGAGTDDYFGETGDDVIRARDGRAERISCGADTDEANNDFVDIIAECERGIDGDADGFSSSVDCNDAVASISPGAAEVLDNGIDENCDGRDNPNLDRDADGFPQPGDCNDANPAVRPNVPEIRGNAVDENCDRRADPFAQLGAFVSNQWAIANRYTRLLSLVVRNAPQGATVTLTCRGRDCPVKRRRRTVSRNLQPIVLHNGFRKRRLRPGTRLRLTVTAAGTIGRTSTYIVKRGALPTRTTVCRAPGAARGRSC